MKKLICYIAFIAFASFVCAQQKVTIEAPSPDPTLVVRGPEKEIRFVDQPFWEKVSNCLYLFSDAFNSKIQSDRTVYTALQIDKNMRVTAIVNGLSLIHI